MPNFYSISDIAVLSLTIAYKLFNMFKLITLN